MSQPVNGREASAKSRARLSSSGNPADGIAYVRALIGAAHPLIIAAERAVARMIDADVDVAELRDLYPTLEDMSTACGLVTDGLQHFGRDAMKLAPVEDPTSVPALMTSALADAAAALERLDALRGLAAVECNSGTLVEKAGAGLVAIERQCRALREGLFDVPIQEDGHLDMSRGGL